MNLLDLLVKISAKDDASGVINNVAKTAQSAASSIQKAFSGIGNSISKEFETLETALALVGHEAENSAQTTQNAFEGIGASIAQQFESIATSIGQIGTSAETAAGNAQRAFDGIGGTISGQFEAIASAATQIGTAMEGAAGVSTSAFDFIAEEVTPQFETITESVSEVGDAAEGAAATTRTAFEGINFNGIAEAAQHAAGVLGNAFQGAGGLALQAIQAIPGAFSGIASAAEGAVAGAKSALESLAETAGSVVSTIGGIAEALGSVGSVIAGGVWSLSSSAVSSYADYEQLVGGVETLFGAGGRTLEEYADWKGLSVEDATEKYNALLEAQEKVFANADNAYITSGMSANDYMDTATFLSASLISSLAGDTVEAADLIETAMVDMSDNANKFGTNLESVTNAYKGFSKRNFTMLDNLKLGYGGTTGEMARLLNDANAIDSSILGEGVVLETSGTHLLDDVGLDQMIKAIHTIQEEMDITGTTTDEAMTTIQGSVNTAKAAWSNMMTAIADDNADFEGTVDKLVTSVDTALSNLLPRISQSLQGIAQLIGTLAPTVISAIPSLLESALPGITEGVEAIITEAAEALPEIVEVVLDNIPEMVSSLESIGSTLIESTKQIVDDILSTFTNAFKEWTGIDLTPITDSLYEVVGLISSLFEGIDFGFDTDAIGGINAAIQTFADALSYLVGAVQGDAFQGVVTSVKDFFEAVGSSLVDNLTPAAEGIKELLQAFLSGDDGVMQLITNTFGLFAKWFTSSFARAIGIVATGVVELLSAFVDEVTEPMDSIVSSLTKLFSASEGKDTILTTIANAIVKILGMFSEILADIIQRVATALENFMGTVSTNEGEFSAFGDTADRVQEAFDHLVENIANVATKFQETLDALGENREPWDDVWYHFGEAAGAAVVSIKDAIVDLVKILTEDLPQALMTAEQALQSSFTGFWNTIWGDITGLSDEEILQISSKDYVLKQTQSKFLNNSDVLANSGNSGIFSSAQKDASEKLGSDIIDGLTTGVNKKTNSFTSAVESALNKANSIAKDAIDAHSPSRVYAKLGGYMVQGLVKGWKDSAHLMMKEIKNSYKEWSEIQTPTMSVDASNSAIGKLTRASGVIYARSGYGSNGTRGYGTMDGRYIVLNINGKEMARALYTPLETVNDQIGTGVKVVNA